jgi:tetratricopeptide (TPR) repeat protein
MACHIANREEQAERYLAARLPENESAAFELHFFSCSPCLSAVRNAEALTDALAETRIERTRPSGNPMWFAVAAAVVAAVSLVTLRSPERSEPIPGEAAPPAPFATNPYAELAAFELPRTPGVTLRSGQPPDLDRGLDLYDKRDFGGAVRALEAAARTVSDAAAPFFLGISLLKVGETDRAITALRAAVARGDSPYLEEAHLYLARAHFAMGDFRAAERELEVTLALKGDRGEEARGLLEKSRSLRPPQ